MGIKNVIELGEREDRVLNIVKAKFCLKNKSEAVTLVVKAFENTLESELRPEYLEKLWKIREGKYTKYNSMEELRKDTSK